MPLTEAGREKLRQLAIARNKTPKMRSARRTGRTADSFSDEERDAIRERAISRNKTDKMRQVASRNVITANKTRERSEKERDGARQRMITRNKTPEMRRLVAEFNRSIGKFKSWLDWNRANPARAIARRARRYARLSNSEGSFTHREWKDLCAKYGDVCLRCGASGKLTPDHIVPLSKGGSNTIDNIQPLCMRCNSSKKDRTVDYRTKT